MLSQLWTKGKHSCHLSLWLGSVPGPSPPCPYLVIGVTRHHCGTVGANGILLTLRGCPGHNDVGRNPWGMREEVNPTAQKSQQPG